MVTEPCPKCRDGLRDETNASMVPYCGSKPASQEPRMRIGIRSAISALVLTSIIVSAVGVHLLWWRTALGVSQTLADTINDQIVSAVGDELQSITPAARSSLTAVRTLLSARVLE